MTFKPRHSCSRGAGASVKPRGSIPKPSRRRRGLGAGASPHEPPNETLSDYNQPARSQYHRSPCQCHRNTGQKSRPQAPDGGERGLCPPRGHGTSPWPPLPGLPRAALPARTRHGLAEGTGGARGVFPASPTPFRLFSRSVTALSVGNRCGIALAGDGAAVRPLQLRQTPTRGGGSDPSVLIIRTSNPSWHRTAPSSLPVRPTPSSPTRCSPKNSGSSSHGTLLHPNGDDAHSQPSAQRFGCLGRSPWRGAPVKCWQF